MVVVVGRGSNADNKMLIIIIHKKNVFKVPFLLNYKLFTMLHHKQKYISLKQCRFYKYS